MAQNYTKYYQLEKWVIIASVTGIGLQEFIQQDEYMQEAAYQAASNYIQNQNKKQQQSLEEMTKSLENMNSNPLSDIKRPSFWWIWKYVIPPRQQYAGALSTLWST